MTAATGLAAWEGGGGCCYAYDWVSLLRHVMMWDDNRVVHGSLTLAVDGCLRATLFSITDSQ